MAGGYALVTQTRGLPDPQVWHPHDADRAAWLIPLVFGARRNAHVALGFVDRGTVGKKLLSHTGVTAGLTQ